MNSVLWEEIEAFDLDYPVSEYGFSIRLANENLWTKNFTQKAITEYKKFMYLAATSEYMVSPSEIVDVVWHQHLIFTQSYTEFCKVLGKQIQHIPSTHNRDEAAKFAEAKNRTKLLYIASFGEEPADVWDYDTMMDVLNLRPAKISIRVQLFIASVVFIMLLSPCFKVLMPVYSHNNNPYFLIGYIVFFITGLFVLNEYNKKYLHNIITNWKNCFINNLALLEVIYLKTGKLGSIMHGMVNDYIRQHKIYIEKDKTISVREDGTGDTAEGYALLSAVQGLQPVTYSVLVGQVVQKPVFANVGLCIKELKRYFSVSVTFARLLFINLAALIVLLLPGTVRIITGFVRNKPTGIIRLVIFMAGVAAIFFFNKHHKPGFCYRNSAVI